MVARTSLALRHSQRTVGLALVQVRAVDLHDESRARRRRLHFDKCHRCQSLLLHRPGFVIDRLAVGQPHVSLFPVLGAADALAEAALLAGLVRHLHAGDLDLEHQFDGLLDLGLVGVATHLERVLVGVLHRQRGLFGDVRGHQHGGETFAAHCRRSSIIFTAPTVSSTLSYAASETGLISATVITSTCGRLRAASCSFSSCASTTISADSSDSFFSSPTRSLVRGPARLSDSVTTSRSVRASCASIERMPARYILRLTFWSKLRGRAAN